MDTVKLSQLQEKYKNAATEEDRIDILSDIALEIRTEDVERALVLADEIMERSEKIGYAKGIGAAYNHKGACYWIKGEYEDGLDELAEAYSIAREINDKSLEAKALNNYGRIYRELGDISNALVHFEEALEINESLDDVINQSINLTNIANLYLDMADYDPALEYALKCLPIFEKDDDKTRLVSIYSTLGNIYFKKEMFPEALEYFKRTQVLTDEHSPAKALANSGVGKVYFKMNDFEKASHFLNIALEQSKVFSNVECEILSEYYLGCMYKEQSLYSKAQAYLERSLQLAEEFLRRQDILGIHEKMSELFDALNDIPRAYQHMKAYEKLKEEIFHQNTFNKLRNLQIKNKIEVAKKEKEVAERTAALKQQFMANMSHEIRTPMNAIVGITRLLLDKQPSDEQKKYLNVIQQSADNLLVIINDILDLTKIEANKIEIEQIDFSVKELVQSTKEMMILKAQEKNLAFNLDIAANIPDRLVGDPTRLNQILVNLVGNAIKFTEKGSVQIRLSASYLKQHKVLIRFDIADTGIGISKQYINSIFESFTQAGSDMARKYGGTGLGLTISKQLVDMMKGRIEVESELEHGTVFSVYLPFDISENQTAVIKKEAVTEEMKVALNKSRVLLVEDNEFNRIVAVETLKSLLPEVRIDIAENGDVAIERLHEKDYDMILMDIQMPVRDGISTTRYIRNEMQEPKRSTKIIAMTANVLQDDVRTYFKEGMDAYISKPFNTEELLLKMSNQLSIQSEAEEETVKEQENSASKTLHLPDQVTDMQFLQQFTGSNPEKRNKYISMFLENCPKLLQQLNTALENKDYATMKITAHSLKPQLGYMGVKEEVSNIYLIEHSAAEAQQEVLPRLVLHLNKVCARAFQELGQVLQG